MNLVRTSLLSAIQTAMKILAGFILLKVVALAAGPEGVARLGQFQNLVSVLSVLCGGMFFTGVTKLIAECRRDKTKAFAVVRASLLASLFSFFLISIVVVVWRDFVAVQVLKDASLDSFVIALPVMVFVTTLYGLLLAVLNGLQRIRELVVTSLASSTLTIVMTVALALPFGEFGAYVAILVSPIAAIIFFIIWRFHEIDWSVFYISVITEFSPYRELARFAFLGIVSTVTVPVVQMVMRDFISAALSLEQAGIWQGLMRISEVYLFFITSTLSVYFVPKLAQAEKSSDIVQILRSILALAMPAVLVIGILVYLFRDLLIWILFTPEFQPMSSLFFWQIVGDVLRVISWVFASAVLLKGSALLFVIGEVVFNLTYLVLGKLLVVQNGIEGAVIAYGVNYLFYLAFVFCVAKYTLRKYARLRHGERGVALEINRS